MKWLELYLKPGADLGRVYDWLKPFRADITSIHFFWDEPWNPEGYVVRVETDLESEDLIGAPGVTRVEPWGGEQTDRDLYGDRFNQAMDFFMASCLMATKDEWLTEKLVHCFLNQRQITWWGEIRFHLRMAWRRLYVIVWWKVKGRREFINAEG